MGLRERVKNHVVEPAVLRLCQWRGDPVARLMLPATKADPYPLYAQVRPRGLVRSPLGVFAAADHATVASILRDRRFSSSPVHQRGYRPPSYPPDDPRAALPAADLLTMDPPDHTRVRRLVTGAFTPRAIAGLEPWIREVTVRLLEAADAAAGFDLIDALAFPLPIAVICHMLGVPFGDHEKFEDWAARIMSVSSTTEQITAAYIEMPPQVIGGRAERLLAIVADRGYRLKLRTGGASPEAFPDEATLAACLAALAGGRVRFKCTAGLHHAVRHTAADTGFEHHGFLNLLLAVGAADAGASLDQVTAVLAEREPAAVAEQVRAIDADEAERIRALVVSVGTCSTDEPVSDLLGLGLVSR